MTGKRLAIVSMLVLSIFAAPSHAATDEVRVLRGTLFQPRDATGMLSMEGTSGVRIEAALDSRFASLVWANRCGNIGCLVGDAVSLLSAYGGVGPLTGQGQITIHGQTYDLWTSFGSDGLDAQFRFDAVIVLPELTSSGTAEVSAPFALEGFVEIPSQREPGTLDVLSLHGSGVATALLTRDRFNAGRWHVDAVTYEFVPRGAAIQQ